MVAASTSTASPSNEKAESVSSAGRSSRSSLRSSLRSIFSRRSSKTGKTSPASSTGSIPKDFIQEPEGFGVALADDEKTLNGDTELDKVDAVTADIGQLELDRVEDKDAEAPALETPGLTPVSLEDCGLASKTVSPRCTAEVSCPLDLEELRAQLVRDVRAHRRRARCAKAKFRPTIAIAAAPGKTPKAKKIGKALLSFFCVSANPDDDGDTPARPVQRPRRPPRTASRAAGRHVSASRPHPDGARKRRRRKTGMQPHPSGTRTIDVPKNMAECHVRTKQGSYRPPRPRRSSKKTAMPTHRPRVHSSVDAPQARPRNPIALESHSSRRPNPKLHRKISGQARGDEWMKAYLPPPQEPGRRSRRSEGQKRRRAGHAGSSPSAAGRRITHEPHNSHLEAQ